MKSPMTKTQRRHAVSSFAALAALAAVAHAGTPKFAMGTEGDDHAPKMDERAKYLPEDREAIDKFLDWRRPARPSLNDWRESQSLTYSGKRELTTPRPLLEWGRRMYTTDPVNPGINWFGESNLLFPHFYVYGDWRTAVGHSNLGVGETSRLATRLNLDLDLGITATERIHALMRPLDRNNNRFTQVGISGFDEDESELVVDGNLETLFFEGDLAAMFLGPGASSIPIAAGLVPLLFQNGVWVEDAFTGVAVSLPAKNSPKLDIANYDWTFFAAFDEVNSGAVNFDPNADTSIFGVTTFLEATGGYWELGYGYTDAEVGGQDASYHNITAAFSQRFGQTLSNSIRVIANVGQDDVGGVNTADGVLVLIENSLITSSPYTFLPYFNVFAGFGTPQSLARAAGAGGVLKNTGLNFEQDAITAFPALDATGHDAVGAAIGVQYLLGLVEQQIVIEVAGQHAHGDDAKAQGDEFAAGIRYQRPIELFGARRALMRMDAMYGTREDADDIAGVRLEFRWKF